MLSKNVAGAVVLGAVLAAASGTGCQKSSDAQRREAENAAAETERRSSEPREYVLDEHHDYFAAIRREQLELRDRLQEEVDDLDRRLAEAKVDVHPDARLDPKSKEARRIEDLLARRATLEADRGLVERSDERGWDRIRAGIERDLAGDGGGGGARRPGGKI